ncbi:MAG: glutathione S-transferase family protein [Beijerinckiaceae bacterium]
MTARYELHGFWPSGPTYKIGLMLSLCGEPFDYVSVNLRAGEHKAPAFVAKQRFGQVPLLIDNGNGRTLCQSASILEYLAEMLGKFAGGTVEEKIAIREWQFWGFDRLAPNIYRARGQRIGLRSMTFETAAMYFTEGNVALKVLDDHLAGKQWMVGNGATIADIDLYGVIDYAEAGGFNLAQYKNLSAWIGRLKALKGFGTPEQILPKESRKA